jgi:hypothetical protein
VGSGPAWADVFTLTWNPVNDARVTQYVLAWGFETLVYDKGAIDVAQPGTMAVTPDMARAINNGIRFFAVKACNADKSMCSAWSNEVRVEMLLGPISYPTSLRIESWASQVQ